MAKFHFRTFRVNVWAYTREDLETFEREFRDLIDQVDWGDSPGHRIELDTPLADELSGELRDCDCVLCQEEKDNVV